MSPPPPNGSFQNQGEGNFRPPHDGQFNQQGQPSFQRPPKDPQQGGQFGQPGKDFQGDRGGNSSMPQKPPMMKSGDTQGRMPPKGSGMNENFQNKQGEEGNFEQGEGDDWEARQQKMDEEQQKREEAMVKKQAAQMAKMIQQNVTTINKRVAKLKAAGIALTAECTETVTALTDAVAKVKSATTREDLEDAQDVMHSMDDVNQCRQIIERLLSVPKMLKSAASTLKSLKKKKVDISLIEPKFTALTEHFNKLKSGGATNDDVEAFFDEADELGDEVSPLLEGKRNSMQGASVFQSTGVWSSFVGWFGL